MSEKVQKTKANVLYRHKPTRTKNNASRDFQASQRTQKTGNQSAKTLKTSKPRTTNPKSGSFPSKSVHNSYNKQSRDIGFLFLGGGVVGELGRPIVGTPRSTDRLKKIGTQQQQQQQKKPKPTTTKIRYLSINQSMEQRKKERKDQRSSAPSLLFCNPPSSQGVGIRDVGHRYLGT